MLLVGVEKIVSVSFNLPGNSFYYLLLHIRAVLYILYTRPITLDLISLKTCPNKQKRLTNYLSNNMFITKVENPLKMLEGSQNS